MSLWDWLFPLRCVGCGGWEVWLCDDCRDKLVKASQKCPECGKSCVGGWTHGRCRRKQGLDGVWMLYGYNPLMQGIVKAIKYRFCEDLIEVCMKREVLDKIFGEVDYLIPVPLHKLRENWRGFNQAEVIAKVLGSRWDVEVIKGVERLKKTKPVAEMESKEERRREVEGVFEVNGEFDLKDKKVVLVDDVFTSGATMKEVAKMLKEAGVKEVYGWVLAG